MEANRKNTIEKPEYATKYVFRERGVTVDKVLIFPSLFSDNSLHHFEENLKA